MVKFFASSGYLTIPSHDLIDKVTSRDAQVALASLGYLCISYGDPDFKYFNFVK